MTSEQDIGNYYTHINSITQLKKRSIAYRKHHNSLTSTSLLIFAILHFLGGEDVDVQKLIKELKSVTQSQFASITGLPKENLRAVADGMFTRGIIGRGVNEEPTYNAIISEFENSFDCYETVAEVEEHCKKFLLALEAVGGGAASKAKQLRKKWIQGVKASLNYQLKINSN